MFDKLNSKQRNFLLLGAFLILAFASYRKAFKPTYENYQNLQNRKMKLDLINTSSSNLDMLLFQSSQLDSYIGKFIDSEHSQHEILNFISKIPTIKISKIDATHFSEVNNFNVYTYQIILEGNYKNLSKIAYELEKRIEYSRIINLEYHVKHHHNKKNQLFLTLTFQNYEKKNS